MKSFGGSKLKGVCRRETKVLEMAGRERENGVHEVGRLLGELET